MAERLVYVDGRIVPEAEAHISALDRGFTLGDGVFDTMRSVRGRVFRLSDHLARLESSARTIGMECPASRDDLAAAIDDLLTANGAPDALVRITLSRGMPAERGLLPPTSPTPTVTMSLTPFHGYPEATYQQGFVAVISGLRRNEASPLSRIKSCNYLDSVLARIEASRQGADEAILLNTAGDIACGSSSNLFLVMDGLLVTPDLASGVLEGITRRTVLELAGNLGPDAMERRVRPEELRQAEELFVTNTALGVMPVVAVDGAPVGGGTPGPVAGRLRSAYSTLAGLE